MKLLPVSIGVLIILAVSGCTGQSIPSPAPGYTQIGQQYYFADSPTGINGKLAYRASLNNNPSKSFIVYAGQEIGKEYDSIKDPAGVNGTIAFLAYNSYTVKYFIVYDGQEIGKQYGSVDSPTSVNGQLAYVASNELPGNESGKTFIVYDGKEYGIQYKWVEEPTDVNGRLAYLASYSSPYSPLPQQHFIVYDGQEIGKEYDNVLCFGNVNGKIAYTAQRNGTLFFVYEGNESKVYNPVCSPIMVGNKIAYFAMEEDGKEFIVYGNQEIGKEYAFVTPPANINGKLAYAAAIRVENRTKQYIVMEK
jgi:hypothetical protein